MTDNAAKRRKGKSKGKGHGKQGKGKRQSNSGIEIYINGGDTPLDVMVLQAWDELSCKALKPFFKKGEKAMISNVYV